MTQRKAFIETNNFPVASVSLASMKEKEGGGRPDYWEMVFWWTRKPLVSARAVIAGCLLPEDVDPNAFVEALRLNQKVPHRTNPLIPDEWQRYFAGKKLLDPFSGFGSIPLEALRLGLSTTAVELLPTAFVFLKAVLDYPLRFGGPLVEDLQRWANWILEQLKGDPVIRELYDADTPLYVGSWQVLCPHCSKWTFLVANHWLAKVRDNQGKYSRVAWFDFEKKDIGIVPIVVDLNKQFGSLEGLVIEGNKVTIKNRTFTAPSSNINPRAQRANCLCCGGTLRFIDPENPQKLYLEKKKLPSGVAKRLQWYVKYALGRYHKTNADIARQRLLVKVKVTPGVVEFEACNDEDQRKLNDSRRYTEALVQSSAIPNEPISPYSGRYLYPILYGIEHWYQLQNSRQQVVSARLVNLVREAAKQDEQQRIRAGKTPKEAFDHSEAIAVYLSLALCRFVDYNTSTTRVDATNPWGMKVSNALSLRGISMQWNWGDTNPIASIMRASGAIQDTSSLSRALSNAVHGLKYLVSAVDRPSMILGPSNSLTAARVFLDDATVLSRLKDETFDVIVTDPPYYDDVPYTELSDFFYVWLKRSLSDSENGKLIPRYLPDAFFKRIDSNWVEQRTQWEELASREVSLNEARDAQKTDATGYFQNLLDASFLSMKSHLNEGGLLVTYYAHTNSQAWKALLRAGWEKSGLSVSSAFPIVTESGESIVKQGKLSLDTSIIVVWRKDAHGTIQSAKLYEQMIRATVAQIQAAIEMKIRGRDLFVGAISAALAEATRYDSIMEMKKLGTSELMDKYVLRAAVYGLVEAISHKARVEEGIGTNIGILYLITKFLYSGSSKKMVSSDDANIFSLGTGVDLTNAVSNLRMFRRSSEEEEGKGSSLAKRKTLVLLEPQNRDRLKLKDLLDYRGIDVDNPTIRCSVDALHVLEYYALTFPREQFVGKLDELKTKHPSEVDEALSLARIMNGSLEGDIEKDICSTLVEKMMPLTRSITDYTGVDR